MKTNIVFERDGWSKLTVWIMWDFLSTLDHIGFNIDDWSTVDIELAMGRLELGGGDH